MRTLVKNIQKGIYLTSAFIFTLVLLSVGTKDKSFEAIEQAQEKAISDLPDQKNNAFTHGEILSYKLYYGFMDAAVATLEVKKDAKRIAGRDCYHIVGNGNSKGTFDFFFKVRDRYETYIDKDALLPWLFVRRCNEGGYLINQDYIFNHYTNKVNIGEGNQIDMTKGSQDMISAFYAARNLDFTNAKKGDVFAMNCFLDKENWPLKIRFVGKENVKTDLGTFRCLKFRPIVQKGRVFKKEEDLAIWISDDANHIPVRAEAKILIGSVKMDLLDYKNILNPIARLN